MPVCSHDVLYHTYRLSIYNERILFRLWKMQKIKSVRDNGAGGSRGGARAKVRGGIFELMAVVVIHTNLRAYLLMQKPICAKVHVKNLHEPSRVFRSPLPIGGCLLTFSLPNMLEQEEGYQRHAQRQRHPDGKGDLRRNPGANDGLRQRTKHHRQ